MTSIELEATFAAIGRFLEKRSEAINGTSGASPEARRVVSRRRNKRK